jgi:hypothetical protein
MVLLLTCALGEDFFLALYHSTIACIRQQSRESLVSGGYYNPVGFNGSANSASFNHCFRANRRVG